MSSRQKRRTTSPETLRRSPGSQEGGCPIRSVVQSQTGSGGIPKFFVKSERLSQLRNPICLDFVNHRSVRPQTQLNPKKSASLRGSLAITKSKSRTRSFSKLNPSHTSVISAVFPSDIKQTTGGYSHQTHSRNVEKADGD
jgi:hypothetical protein